ncbi:unnamed protein product [Linum trigynum]|uniref:RING-type E3 ubiquitin transferase n=1 Tax=Linum trigynum TaxID=586398 RepID=A0AAV2G4P5_9ROSI
MPDGGGGGGPLVLPDHATPTAGLLLQLVRDIILLGGGGNACAAAQASSTTTTTGPFRKDSTDLVRRISLLAHLLDEIADFAGESGPLDGDAPAASSSCATGSWCSALLAALQSSKRLLLLFAGSSKSSNHSDGAHSKIALQFQSVTCKLEKALADIPFDRFNISEEVQEQVALVRSQLQRASERYRSVNAETISSAAPAQQPLGKEIYLTQKARSNNSRLNRSWKIENFGCVNHNVAAAAVESNDADQVQGEEKPINSSGRKMSLEDLKKSDAPTIPDDFLCPISLELMRDPVIVATGQTYERSFIQRWVDAGNKTCPKTQQKLQHSTLTPNYVLRSLIAQWCAKHNIEQPTGFTNAGRLKNGDGRSFRDTGAGDSAAVQSVVRKLSSRSVEERRAAVHEIRILSKRSTDNRILIAEAGAIPVLVGLLTASDDVATQENAVTSILNLSIYENNKGAIMLAGAVPSIVQVLRAGSVEAKENAAATVFSLSLGDENKIIIGASGAIPALVELLEQGSSRGKKDAASALFNLCIYQGNKGRAVRAGIVPALLRMLTDSRGAAAMVDEALTILSVLSSNVEAKAAIVKASTIPVLIDLLRTGQPRGKENAASILLSLCRRDAENLACVSRLGAVVPLTELAKSGRERAKRKADSLLEHIRKLQPH